jgi:hypothetical protein
MIKSSWAVLLCKFNDDSTEPFTRDYYEDLFTASGVGSHNMVDFFRDVSHGNLDLSDSRVFGWYTLTQKLSDYGLTGAEKLKNRHKLISSWAVQAAAANGDDLSQYVSSAGSRVVVCMNVPTDLFSDGVGGGAGVVCDNLSTEPRSLGQEMGHFYGLDHSRADTIIPCGDDSGEDYKDFWDVMSTAGCAHSAPHPRYGFIGPGLNAANMASRNWLDESRVWNTSNRSFDTVVQIRPLHRRDLPGYLAARLGPYLVEFRIKESWDASIPRPTMLIHRFEDNHSYIMSANNGDQDLVVGSVFGTADTGNSNLSIFTGVTKIEVIEINANEQFAKIRLVYYPPFEEPSLGGILFGGVDKGGSGHIFVPGRGFVPIPPHSPFVHILQQIAAYESSELIASVHLRNTVRREALSAIASLVENQMQTLQAFRQPAPRQQTQECEGE